MAGEDTAGGRAKRPARSAPPITPAQVKAIKAAQRFLGIDDGAYRLLLSGYPIATDPARAGTPAASCKDISRHQAQEVITRLQLAGAPIGRPYGAPRPAASITALATPSTDC